MTKCEGEFGDMCGEDDKKRWITRIGEYIVLDTIDWVGSICRVTYTCLLAYWLGKGGHAFILFATSPFPTMGTTELAELFGWAIAMIWIFSRFPIVRKRVDKTDYVPIHSEGVTEAGSGNRRLHSAVQAGKDNLPECAVVTDAHPASVPKKEGGKG